MDFFIAEGRQHPRRILQYKGDVKSHSFDFTPWADDNGALTTATWTVESGQVTLSSKTLASSVASALFTTTEAGNSLVTLSVTDGTHTEVVYIRVFAKDPQIVTSEDY